MGQTPGIRAVSGPAGVRAWGDDGIPVFGFLLAGEMYGEVLQTTGMILTGVAGGWIPGTVGAVCTPDGVGAVFMILSGVLLTGVVLTGVAMQDTMVGISN